MMSVSLALVTTKTASRAVRSILAASRVPTTVVPIQRGLTVLASALRHLDAALEQIAKVPLPEKCTVSICEVRELRRPHSEAQQEINGSKSLLLEIVRRAAYDWVLYRTSTRLINKRLAEESYHWLFVEKPGSLEWAERCRSGKQLTSFVSICESLDLDPDNMRMHIKRLTAKNVMNVGRPAEYRRVDLRDGEEHTSTKLPPSLRDDSDPTDFEAFEFVSEG